MTKEEERLKSLWKSLKAVDSNWSLETLRLAVKAGFRCEYCGRDVYGSLGDYYLFSQENTTVENGVYVCQVCRNLNKSRSRADDGKDADREELIAAARAHVAKMLRVKELEISRARELTLEFYSKPKQSSSDSASR